MKLKCHVLYPLILMGLSFLIDRSVFHLLLVIGFVLFLCKWSISSSPVSYVMKSQSTCYSILLILDFLVWGSSSFWSEFIPLNFKLQSSSTHHLLSKLFSLLAYACMQMCDGEEEDAKTRVIKSKSQMLLENRLRVIKTFFYHFVNSPVGLFIQNGLVLFWVFMYPSVFSVVLLLISSLNVVSVRSEKIDEYIILSPRRWSQNLLVGYAALMSVIYYAMTSGLSSLLEKNSRVYYFFLGGLTRFNVVNWVGVIILFFMAWFATV